MKCLICNNELLFSWTDYHGEGECVMCGTPYQIYQYDEENNRIPDTTPIIKIHEQYFDELRAYWNETHARNGLGMYVEWKSERLAFENWVNARKTPIT